MKKLLFTCGVAILILVVYFGFLRTKPTQSETAAVKTVQAVRGPIELAIASTGRVVSNLDVEIKCKASGEVVEVPVDVSRVVKKGDLLVKIDPIDEQRNVRLAEVTLSSAKAKLRQAELNLEYQEKSLETQRQQLEATLKSNEAKSTDEAAKAKRMKELLVKKLASQEECDASVTSEIEAKANVENTRAKLRELDAQELQLDVKRQEIQLSKDEVERDEISLQIKKRSLNDTQVFSPIDGVVVAKEVQIGQIISSGITNVGGGTSMMTVSDLSRIFIIASVDESDIGQVKIGQTANITVDAFPDVQFTGKVQIITPQGVNESNVVTFDVKIEVMSENKSLLMPEMTANIDIIADRRDNVLLLPSDAVLLKNQKYWITVVKSNGEQEERPIETGINNFTNVEIIKGATLGETVVLHETAPVSQWNSNGGGGPPPPP